MKYRTRTFYSETQKAMMWDRWRQGESLHEIAQLLTATIPRLAAFLAQNGRHPSAATECAAAVVLSLSEREEISRGVVAGRSMRTMAALTRTGTEHSEP